MILVSKTYWGNVPFHFRSPPADASLESVALRTDDFRPLRALWWTPRSSPSPKVAVVVMHPRVDFSHHYSIPRLLQAGIGCLGANGRNPNNDLDTEHEGLVLDVAACVRWLREKRGVEKVVLLGNSGGGSLFGFYQSQAVLPPAARLVTSPAGTPTRFADTRMIPADLMIYLAAHRGQGNVLQACIDPSVVDESDPHAVDAELDMYHPKNGFRPPPELSRYDDAFVVRYREAQRARVKRLDDQARAHVAAARAVEEELKGAGELSFEARQSLERRQAFEPVMVVYRTMANPNYVDHHLDPSPREYGSLLSDRPDLMNMALLGFARTVTPRAFLSTWSSLSSNADLPRNVRAIPQPTLVVHAERDREVYPRDAKELFDSVAAEDKTFVQIEGARHYFEPDFGEKSAPLVDAAMDVVVRWIRERAEG
jgi:pimeloyl-ACP methyl ester carboxylesterase